MFFIAVAYVLWLLWQLLVIKNGIYCYPIADILGKKNQKCLLSGTLPNI